MAFPCAAQAEHRQTAFAGCASQRGSPGFRDAGDHRSTQVGGIGTCGLLQLLGGAASCDELEARSYVPWLVDQSVVPVCISSAAALSR